MNLPSARSAEDTGAMLRDSALIALQTTRMQVNRTYLGELQNYDVLELPADIKRLNAATDVRINRICRLVHENRQSILESLTAAYTALGSAGYTVMLYLDSDGEKTDLYIGTRGSPGCFEGESAGLLLQEAFRGHFAGSAMDALPAQDVNQALKNLASPASSSGSYISAVTGVPSLATEDVERFSQGLERFLDAAERRRYRALILAEPMPSRQLEEIRTSYEQMATQLSPLQKMSWSYGDQDSYSVGTSLSRSLGQTLGSSLGVTETTGTTETEGTSSTHTTEINSSTQQSTLASKIAAGIGATATIGGLVAGASAAAAGTAAAGAAGAVAAGAATIATGGLAVPVVLAVGGAVNQIFGGTKSEGTSTSESTGTNHSTSISTSRSTSETQSNSVSETVSDGYSDTSTQSSSRQLSVEFNDKGIEQLLVRIDQHLSRIEEARTYGGWTASAYFIADSKVAAEALSSIFLGLIRGQNSNLEDFAVTTWSGEKRARALDWLGQLTHPVLRRQLHGNRAVHVTTPATLLSGREVALQLNLPRRSTSTVSVVETQAFGRRIQHVDGRTSTAPAARTLNLGKMRHLWENLKQTVDLDMDQLCRHMFICGSTGSGKSNAIYNLLHGTHAAGIPFLIIEPAKGEYKHVVGHWKGVRVLGTNPNQAELLRLNPFAFPDQIHVLEHVDRMVEIFNVCWPMYAAMPAVLKDAILQAYIQCGWDLEASCNQISPRMFPNFSDLLESLQRVIAASDYAEEVKSNYLGALGTRLQSLCNGMNARLFGAEELSNAELFDASVVIDLSRIGSSETRALVMGMLVMRLSEHRMAVGGMNERLRHLTVLEEAHNLLPRSVTGGAEGASMTGKSVEMLSSAIAEMRTYGEGFIIADQSPHAVDMSAIRNTNIKVVLRLPEETDRRLIGGSMGLNDGQIAEIARLPSGAAVVHQNDWLEPVLCQMTHHQGQIQPYVPEFSRTDGVDMAQWRIHVANLLLGRRTPRAPRVDQRLFRHGLGAVPLSSRVRLALTQMLDARLNGKSMPGDVTDGFSELAALLVDAWGCRRELIAAGRTFADVPDARDRMHRLIKTMAPGIDNDVGIAVEQCMMRVTFSNGIIRKNLYTDWRRSLEGEIA